MKNEKCFENEKLKDGFHMYFVSNNQIFVYWLSLAGTRNRFVNYTHYELKQVVGPTSSKHYYVAKRGLQMVQRIPSGARMSAEIAM